MDNWANPHIVSFFKEMLKFKVSPYKTVIYNFGKKMYKYNKIFCGSAVLKVSSK